MSNAPIPRILISTVSTVSKKFIVIFLKACDKLNVEPEEALVLEDSEAGIQAASEAKISVICIPDMKFPQEKYLKKVEHVYDSLEDVISYLEMKKDISK